MEATDYSALARMTALAFDLEDDELIERNGQILAEVLELQEMQRTMLDGLNEINALLKALAGRMP